VSYRYQLAPKAERYLRRADRATQERVKSKLHRLCENPFDEYQSKPLKGKRHADVRRARVGDLRILFSVHETIEILEVMDVGPRGDIYKGL